MQPHQELKISNLILGWKMKLVAYYRRIYNRRELLVRLGVFLVIGLIIMSVTLVLRSVVLQNYTYNSTDRGNGELINFQLVFNPGVSFGFLGTSPAVVYLFQIVPLVVIFGLYWSVSNRFIYICLAITFFGGLANLIDRVIPDYYNYLVEPFQGSVLLANKKAIVYHTVVDYFRLHNHQNIFNLADIFVILGVGFIIIYLVIGYVQSKKLIVSRKKPVNSKNKS